MGLFRRRKNKKDAKSVASKESSVPVTTKNGTNTRNSVTFAKEPNKSQGRTTTATSHTTKKVDPTPKTLDYFASATETNILSLRNKGILTSSFRHKSPKDRAGKGSWLCRTSFFKNLVESAFDVIDQDGCVIFY